LNLSGKVVSLISGVFRLLLVQGSQEQNCGDIGGSPMRRGVLLLALVRVIVVFGVLSATATAGRFSLSDQTFRATFSRVNFLAGLAGIAECPLTLEGSFNTRTFIRDWEEKSATSRGP
jgi:flagellar biosynthesis protein FlhB